MIKSFIWPKSSFKIDFCRSRSPFYQLYTSSPRNFINISKIDIYVKEIEQRIGSYVKKKICPHWKFSEILCSFWNYVYIFNLDFFCSDIEQITISLLGLTVKFICFNLMYRFTSFDKAFYLKSVEKPLCEMTMEISRDRFSSFPKAARTSFCNLPNSIQQTVGPIFLLI